MAILPLLSNEYACRAISWCFCRDAVGDAFDYSVRERVSRAVLAYLRHPDTSDDADRKTVNIQIRAAGYPRDNRPELEAKVRMESGAAVSPPIALELGLHAYVAHLRHSHTTYKPIATTPTCESELRDIGWINESIWRARQG